MSKNSNETDNVINPNNKPLGSGFNAVDQNQVDQSGSSGFVTIDGERVAYEDLQANPYGVGKIMKRKIQ